MLPSRFASLTLLFLLSSGCAIGLHEPSSRTASDDAARWQPTPSELAAARAREHAQFEQSEAELDKAVDAQEAGAEKALREVSGYSATTAVRALRGTSIKMSIRLATDAAGNQSGMYEQFVLESPAFERIHTLSREAPLSRAKAAELKSLTKHVQRLTDLGSQVSAISTTTMMSNVYVQTQSLAMMLAVANKVRGRKMMGQALDAEDIGEVKRMLTRMHRAEAVAGTTMGMLAVFQAVVNDGGDPQALDAYAERALRAFPVKAAVTDDEARRYVDDFATQVGAQKAKYEKMIRSAYGDAKYERYYKTSVDQLFAQAEAAQAQRSWTEMQAERKAKQDADLRKCARGEPVSEFSDIGIATPAECRRKLAQMGDTTSTSAVDVTPTRVKHGIAVAGAIARGDVSGALDGASKLVPGDGPLASSLAGVAALSRGDARGALGAAINLVPGGSIAKEGLSFATSLLFGEPARAQP